MCHFGLLFQTPFCKWRWSRRWRRRQHRTAATAPLRPQGDVSCAKSPPRPVHRRIEQNAPGLAPVVRDLQWSSRRLLPCENDTVLNDPRLVYDGLLLVHIQGNCLCSQTVRSRICTMALVALVGINVPMEAKESKWGTGRLPTFRSYAVLPSRPTANPWCMLAAYGTSHVNRSWSAHCQFDRSDMSVDDILLNYL